jgi:hypothetical protein
VYNNIDRAIYDAFTAAAKKTIHKKSGYKRSLDLGEAGLRVNFWKLIKSSIYRRSPPPPECEEGLSLLNARLLAQTKYGLHLSQFPPDKCQQLSVIINESILPILNLIGSSLIQ